MGTRCDENFGTTVIRSEVPACEVRHTSSILPIAPDRMQLSPLWVNRVGLTVRRAKKAIDGGGLIQSRKLCG
jgi:hypothetical protein